MSNRRSYVERYKNDTRTPFLIDNCKVRRKNTSALIACSSWQRLRMLTCAMTSHTLLLGAEGINSNLQRGSESERKVNRALEEGDKYKKVFQHRC